MKNLKKELTPENLKRLKNIILRHFSTNLRYDRFNKMIAANNFKELDENLGLAYTSSSSFAMLGICNTEVYLDMEKKYIYNCFGVDEFGFAVAVCHNKEDDSELYIHI